MKTANLQDCLAQAGENFSANEDIQKIIADNAKPLNNWQAVEAEEQAKAKDRAEFNEMVASYINKMNGR